MRLDLLSRRGPGGRSTSASALRPAAAAAISVGVRGGTAPRQPRSGTRGVWPQRVCWLGYENASGDSCRRAPTVASSAFSRPPVRGEAKEPPRRLAKHRRVAPLTRGGVTAPPSKPLTKGGESRCSASLARHGGGWDVHGHPTLASGRSRTSGPMREGLQASLNGCVPKHLPGHARPPDLEPVGERLVRLREAAPGAFLQG